MNNFEKTSKSPLKPPPAIDKKNPPPFQIKDWLNRKQQ